jgi:hypothetical protein
MDAEITASVITVAGDAAFIGRFAAGKAVTVCTAIAKEPGIASTGEPRETLSGQVIPGLGGYTYRTLSLDSRYKIGKEAVEELTAGYKYTAMGYPFFLDLSEEAYKLPFDKLYAAENNQRNLVFQSGLLKYRYSYRFNFKESF